MAAKPRKAGHKVVFVETPQDIAARLAAVADHNRRSTTAEAVVAFERHVKAEEARILAEQAETVAKHVVQIDSKPAKRKGAKS